MNNFARKGLLIFFYLCLCIELKAAELNMLAFPQVSDYTCWAACAQSVLHWYQKQFSMQDILDYATCGSDQEPGCMGGTCCSNNCFMTCKNDIALILLNMGGIPTTYTGMLTLSQLTQLIEGTHNNNTFDGSRPIIINISGGDYSDGHFIVVLGTTQYAIGYIDPWKNYLNPSKSGKVWHNYVDFNNEYTYNASLYPNISPTGSFNSVTLQYPLIKYMLNLYQGNGGGHLGDEQWCAPWTINNGCQGATGCATNVHYVNSMIWFGNIPGSYFSYPVSFPREGIYKIKLTLRGSVCSAGGNSNCNYWKNLRDVNEIASVSIGDGSNYIRGKTTVIGKDLDRIAYSSIYTSGPKKGTGEELVCRAYTMAAKDLSNPVYPLIEPGDKEVVFEAVVTQPAVENVKIKLVAGPPSITGLSIHKIETQFVRNLIYGCKDPAAENTNTNADIDCCCTYPPPPPPPPPPPTPPPYCRVISFTGSQTDWQSGCACLAWDYECPDNGYDSYKIFWGDGTTESSPSNSTINDYHGKVFTHTYCTPGTYTPYVEIYFLNSGCFFNSKATATKPLGQIVVKKPDLTPIINLLLE